MESDDIGTTLYEVIRIYLLDIICKGLTEQDSTGVWHYKLQINVNFLPVHLQTNYCYIVIINYNK